MDPYQESQANRIEIDLVLQGQPTLDYSRDGLPAWDYAITVARSTQPERYEIYTATLRKRLPRFRLPLAPKERDLVLDLQSAFSRCFAQGGYLGRIDYSREPPAELADEDRHWLGTTLEARGLRRPPSHEEVALAAYLLWVQEGCPHGRDKEHWYTALEQLRRKQGR
jgi:hypothetical protein